MPADFGSPPRLSGPSGRAPGLCIPGWYPSDDLYIGTAKDAIARLIVSA